MMREARIHRRRRTAPPIILIILFIILCLGSILAVVGYLGLQGQVSQKFGPPRQGLTLVQRLTYQIKLYLYSDRLTEPYEVQGAEQPFSIVMGESVGSISYRLETNGFIPDADLFRTYLVYSGLDTGLQAGDYQINPAIPPVAIANQLQDATPKEVDFRILEGWRIEEIADALPTSGLSISPQEFLAAVSQPKEDLALFANLPVEGSLEGFLFPDMYRFDRGISLGEMLTYIFQNFELKVTPEIQEGFSRQGLSLYEAVTLASIVEREAVVAEEQAMIASVFYNRLAAGMKLDSDPTVQYAVGYNEVQKTWWTNPLSSRDLQVSSNYNTYVHTGLPPSPIANPGLSALMAVAYPAQTPYYYFRARCDGTGKHSFAVTYEEHLNNACP